jgi:hypothetical protein
MSHKVFSQMHQSFKNFHWCEKKEILVTGAAINMAGKPRALLVFLTR